MTPTNANTFVNRSTSAAAKAAEGITTAQTTAPVTDQTTTAPTTAQTTEAPTVNTTTTAPTTAQTTEAPTVNTTTTAPVDSNAELLKNMNAALGTNFASMDEATAAINKKELTEEERARIASAKDQQLLSEFIESGKGTMDDFYKIRNLKTAPDDVVTKAAFAAEMLAAFPTSTNAEIESAYNDHYFIAEGNEFSPAEKALGAARIKSDAERIRLEAARPLSEVEHNIQRSNEAAVAKKDWEAKVNSFQVPKSINISIGVMGEKDFGDFEYPLKEEQITELTNSLKDPAFLFKELQDPTTKKTDLSKLAEFVMWKKFGRNAIVAASNHYHSKGLDEISDKLDNTPGLTKTATDVITTPAQDTKQAEKEAGEISTGILGGGRNRRKKFITS